MKRKRIEELRLLLAEKRAELKDANQVKHNAKWGSSLERSKRIKDFIDGEINHIQGTISNLEKIPEMSLLLAAEERLEEANEAKGRFFSFDWKTDIEGAVKQVIEQEIVLAEEEIERLKKLKVEVPGELIDPNGEGVK